MLSLTVTVAVQALVRLATSVTVKVTVRAPMFVQVAIAVLTVMDCKPQAYVLLLSTADVRIVA
jgi:hypothetical protein